MYGQQPQTSPEQIRDNATNDLVSRLNNLNDNQSGLLNQIEDKLHSILNLRSPSGQDMKGVEKPMLTDFVSKQKEQLERLAYNTSRLESFLKHLDQIV